GDEIEAGNLAECATYGLGVAGVRVDARADRGGAHVDLAHERSRFTEPIDVFIDRYAVRVELLAECHRHRVLKLCPSHLQYVGELLGLLEEGVTKRCHCTRQLAE